MCWNQLFVFFCPFVIQNSNSHRHVHQHWGSWTLIFIWIFTFILRHLVRSLTEVSLCHYYLFTFCSQIVECWTPSLPDICLCLYFQNDWYVCRARQHCTFVVTASRHPEQKQNSFRSNMCLGYPSITGDNTCEGSEMKEKANAS